MNLKFSLALQNSNFRFSGLANLQYPNRNLNFHSVGETSDPAVFVVLWFRSDRMPRTRPSRSNGEKTDYKVPIS